MYRLTLIILLIVPITMAACTSKSQPTYAGHYKWKQGANEAELNIWHEAPDTIRFKGMAFWTGQFEGQIHIGEVEGQSKLIKGVASYQQDGADPKSCQLKFSFSGQEMLQVSQQGVCGGYNVTFQGTYKKHGPPEERSSQ